MGSALGSVGLFLVVLLELASSYQSAVLVASSRVVRDLDIEVLDGAFSVALALLRRDGLLLLDDATTVAFFFLRFILWPPSSSDEVKPESESEAAGGVGSLLRTFALGFAPRFLNEITGASSTAASAMLSCFEN